MVKWVSYIWLWNWVFKSPGKLWKFCAKKFIPGNHAFSCKTDLCSYYLQKWWNGMDLFWCLSCFYGLLIWFMIGHLLKIKTCKCVSGSVSPFKLSWVWNSKENWHASNSTFAKTIALSALLLERSLLSNDDTWRYLLPQYKDLWAWILELN